MSDTRIALVTGANQGVGFQVAKELVANGVTVYLGSRNLDRGEAAAKEIGPGAIALQIDITDGASIAAAAERIRSERGRLDLLVNNAGISNTRLSQASAEERSDQSFLEDYVKSSKASTAAMARSSQPPALAMVTSGRSATFSTQTASGRLRTRAAAARRIRWAANRSRVKRPVEASIRPELLAFSSARRMEVCLPDPCGPATKML